MTPHAAPQAQAEPTSQRVETIEDKEDPMAVVRRVVEAAEPVANWIFRMAGVVAALSLLYLLYGIFSGRIGQPEVAPAVVNNMKMAAMVLQWSLILLALSGVWLALDMPYLGLMLIAVGVGLHFGAPWVLMGPVGKSAATVAIAAVLRSTGFAIAIIGMLKQGYEVVVWAMDLPNRMKQKADVGVAAMAEPGQRRVAREANMFSPCWKLPFCREVIRKQCPAFLAKKTCWKFGRGCYCDEEMIGRIIRGESLEVIKAPTRLSRQGKPPCGRCHIYLEHQGFKFKMLSPLTVPLSVLIMFLIWPHYVKAFQLFGNLPIWDALSLDTTKITPDAIATEDGGDKSVSTLSTDQVVQVATIMFGVLLGFFIIIYISKFIEWAVYKAKW